MPRKLEPGDRRFVSPVEIVATEPVSRNPAWTQCCEELCDWSAEVTNVLLEDDIFKAFESMKNYISRPNVLILLPQMKARLDYIAATVCIWALPGAIRWRGPDGKTWIEKQWKTANEGYGNGNQAKRRMGLVPVHKYYGEVEWVRKEEVHGPHTNSTP